MPASVAINDMCIPVTLTALKHFSSINIYMMAFTFILLKKKKKKQPSRIFPAETFWKTSKYPFWVKAIIVDSLITRSRLQAKWDQTVLKQNQAGLIHFSGVLEEQASRFAMITIIKPGIQRTVTWILSELICSPEALVWNTLTWVQKRHCQRSF